MASIRLWHLPTSHYSEKVRWALDHKRIPHARRVPIVAPPPLVSFVLTRGASTRFPVAQFDGRVVNDSTAIIAELERALPDPPLYPVDAAGRERALGLEDWFDEGLGAHVRLVALNAVTRDREVLAQLAARHAPASMRRFPDVWAGQFGGYLRRRYGLADRGALERARAEIGTAFDRLERELGDRDHLVGDAFTVADLTAASHFYWLIQPPEGPRIVSRLPQPLVELMAPHRQRRGYRWVLDTYRRHRRPRASEPTGRVEARRSMVAG